MGQPVCQTYQKTFVFSWNQYKIVTRFGVTIKFPSLNGLDLWLMLPEKMYQHREILKFLYGLLIDAHPSNQNTVLTTLVNIKKIMNQHNQYHSSQC